MYYSVVAVGVRLLCVVDAVVDDVVFVVVDELLVVNDVLLFWIVESNVSSSSNNESSDVTGWGFTLSTEFDSISLPTDDAPSPDSRGCCLTLFWSLSEFVVAVAAVDSVWFWSLRLSSFDDIFVTTSLDDNGGCLESEEKKEINQARQSSHVIIKQAN